MKSKIWQSLLAVVFLMGLSGSVQADTINGTGTFAFQAKVTGSGNPGVVRLGQKDRAAITGLATAIGQLDSTVKELNGSVGALGTTVARNTLATQANTGTIERAGAKATAYLEQFGAFGQLVPWIIGALLLILLVLIISAILQALGLRRPGEVVVKESQPTTPEPKKQKVMIKHNGLIGETDGELNTSGVMRVVVGNGRMSFFCKPDEVEFIDEPAPPAPAPKVEPTVATPTPNVTVSEIRTSEEGFNLKLTTPAGFRGVAVAEMTLAIDTTDHPKAQPTARKKSASKAKPTKPTKPAKKATPKPRKKSARKG